MICWLQEARQQPLSKSHVVLGFPSYPQAPGYAIHQYVLLSYLHNLILQLGQKPIHNLILLDRQAVQINLLHALNLARLDQSAQLRHWLPFLLFILVGAASRSSAAAAPSSTVSASVAAGAESAATGGCCCCCSSSGGVGHGWGMVRKWRRGWSVEQSVVVDVQVCSRSPRLLVGDDLR